MSKIPAFTALRLIPREESFLDRTTGNRGEIYYDRDSDTLRLFDGTNRGGTSLAKSNLSNVSVDDFRNSAVSSRISTVVYTVTITGPQGGDTGNKYNLNGVYRPEPNFVVGYTYVFVQDDQTNVYFPNANGTTPNPHPLNFSSDNLSGERGSGTSYLTNVRYFLNGASVTQAVYNSAAFNTATSRQVWITVTNTTPATLYYWCWNHTAMGNSISVADPGSGSGSGGVSVSVSEEVPASPNQGSLWLDTNTGSLYVYYDDGNSAQWVQPAFPFPLLASVATSGEYNDLINRPDLSNYPTISYVNNALSTYATISYVNNALSTLPIEQFSLNVAADDSTQRLITSGNLIKFVGAGGVTTSSDADGTITITGGGSTGNITFVGSTIDSSDSSSINFTPSVLMQSDLTIENDLIVNNLLTTVSLSVDNILLQGNLSIQGSIISDNEIFITPGTTTVLNGLTTFYQSTEVINTKTGATGTVEHDFSTGAIWYHSSLASNFTANFTNVPTTNDRTINVILVLIQGATARVPSALQINGGAQTINWQDNVTPVGNSNKRDIISFSLIRTSNNWLVLGSLSTYG
jgi:hypothetical protein